MFKDRKVLQDIQSQKETFNKYADKLSEIVQDKIKVSKGLISIEQKKAKQSKRKLQEKFDKVQDLINSIDTFKVFENSADPDKSLETVKQPIKLSCTFIPN